MYSRILIVIDRWPAARAAVQAGLDLARAFGAPVLLFTVLPGYPIPFADMPMLAEPSPEQFRDDAIADARHRLDAAAALAVEAGIGHDTELGDGSDEARCILQAAQQGGCDLIVVTSSGHNAVMRLLGGSAIPGLITRSEIPLLVVRQHPSDGAPAEPPPAGA